MQSPRPSQLTQALLQFYLENPYDLGVTESEMVMAVSYLTSADKLDEELLPIFDEFINRVISQEFEPSKN